MQVKQSALRVIVMGCSRGGATLTQRLVAERLGLYSLPETRFFANLFGNLEPRMFPTTYLERPWLRRTSSTVRERLGLSTGMEHRNIQCLPQRSWRKWSPIRKITDAFIATLDHKALDEGKTGWLEKMPFHVHYAPQIQPCCRATG